MKLSRKQFDGLLQKNKLTLSIVGMSNIGKTYWSEKLAELGFKHFSCDGLIEAKLASELKARGYSGIRDVSRWMGQPYNKRFSINQWKYLNFEKEVIESIFKKLKNTKKCNAVIDTTGSVVHLGENICSKMKKNSLVIYIEATNAMREEMFRRYLKDPKPVVFGDIFVPQKGETGMQTLRRCYPKLLLQRSKLYAKYADVVIPYRSTGKNTSTEEFISLIRKRL